MGPRKFWGNSKRKTLKPKEPLKIYLLCSRHPWKQKKRGPLSFWTGDKSESPVGSWIFLLQASGHPPSPLVFEKANQRNPPFEKKNRRPPPGLCSLFGQNTDQTQGHTHIKHPCTPASTVSLSRLSEPAAGRGPLALCQKQRPAAPPLPFGFFFFQQRRPLPVQQRRLPPADPAPPPNSPTAAPFFLRPNTAAAPAVLFPVFSQSHRDKSNNNPAAPADRQPSGPTPATWSEGDEDVTPRKICGGTDLKNGGEADLKKERTGNCLCLLGCLAGGWEIHRRYKREEKKRRPRFTSLLVLAGDDKWIHAPPGAVVREVHAPQCSCKFQTASLQLLLFLGSVFCNFGIVKVLFG
jgi:hypothetical protein